MARRLVIVLLCALAPGCKSMGGFGNALGGLGHAAGHLASGLGHVAGHAAAGLARAAPAVARGMSHAGPGLGRALGNSVVRASESVAEAIIEGDFEYEVNQDVSAPRDPCASCPIDVNCEDCSGYGGYACELAPPGKDSTCMSTAPSSVVPFAAN